MEKNSDTHETPESTEDSAKKKGSLLSRLLLILGVGLLAAALIIGGYIVWQYLDAQNRYNEIKEVAGLEINMPDLVDANLQLEDLVFDWDALKEMNSDVVGWIIVPGTNVNYPIVQGDNNDYYLYHLFDSSSSGTGSIFADYEGVSTLDGQHNIVYGHNMLDGSMFSDIFMYTGQSYFDEHRTIFLCTPAANFELSAVAALDVPENAPLRQFIFDDEAAFTAFVQETLSSSVSSASDQEELVAKAKTLYSFVTCETFDFSKRVVLCAVPIRSVVPANAS